MNIGVVQERHPPEARILFENPRLETIPSDNPVVGEIPIFLRRDLLDGILRTEAGGGLLLGAHSISNGVEFLEVEAVTTAPGANPSGFPFSVEDWEASFRDWQERQPDSIGLGWWLVRQGGVSAGPFERGFHEAFFPLHWQVALLVDAEAKTVRFHQWKQRRFEECGYFVVQPRRT